MTATSSRLLTLTVLAVLMAASRGHAFDHFSPPDASWAVFFIAGFHLRGWGRWAFPLLMALAVAVDWWVIRGQGIDFWSHYCVSPGYWFLLPAYGAMWAGGALLRRYQTANHGRTLALLVGSLLASVTVCHLLSQGSFYWLSPVVSEPTLAGWWKNYTDWFLPYLTSTAIYVGLATIVHVGVLQVARLRASASSTN